MSAIEKISVMSADALGSVWVCYAPLIDKKRKAMGTRLSVISARVNHRPPVGVLLNQLTEMLPATHAPYMVALLDFELDETVDGWQIPKHLLLEVPARSLMDPAVQSRVQSLARAGARLVLRGRPVVSLPPALVGCFEYAIIHPSENRRKGIYASMQAGMMRRIPFIASGVQTVDEAIDLFDQGAAACIGWPVDDHTTPMERPLQPGQSVVLELLRLVRDDADFAKLDETLRRDPALAFKLLRLVNSAAFNLPVEITSFHHAVMMLGYKKLTRWLTLLLATASKDSNTFPLMHASIRRGIFLEKMAGDGTSADEKDELFLAGAFSLLDKITGATFPKLFEVVSLSEAVVAGITRREGPYGAYLSLIDTIERSDPIGMRRLCESLAVPTARCNEVLLHTLAAAQVLDGEV